MIIKMRLIKRLRKDRKCDGCYRWMFKDQSAVYMFGMAEYGDKPYGIWLHRECVTNHSEKSGMIALEEGIK